MWPTVKDAGGFQWNKTPVWPVGPNVAASGKQSREIIMAEGQRPDGQHM